MPTTTPPKVMSDRQLIARIADIVERRKGRWQTIPEACFEDPEMLLRMSVADSAMLPIAEALGEIGQMPHPLTNRRVVEEMNLGPVTNCCGLVAGAHVPHMIMWGCAGDQLGPTMEAPHIAQQLREFQQFLEPD